MKDTTKTLTPENTETSQTLLDAIYRLARSETEANRIWSDPTFEEALSIWEYVTGNGRLDSRDYGWGASGTAWARELGIETD